MIPLRGFDKIDRLSFEGRDYRVLPSAHSSDSTARLRREMQHSDPIEAINYSA
jgi:hypothetical protein